MLSYIKFQEEGYTNSTFFLKDVDYKKWGEYLQIERAILRAAKYYIWSNSRRLIFK